MKHVIDCASLEDGARNEVHRNQELLTHLRLVVEASVLHGDGGVRGQLGDGILVLLGELRAVVLLREVEVAEDAAADRHGHAEERCHRWMVGRESYGAWVVLDALESQRSSVFDKGPEDAVTFR